MTATTVRDHPLFSSDRHRVRGPILVHVLWCSALHGHVPSLFSSSTVEPLKQYSLRECNTAVTRSLPTGKEILSEYELKKIINDLEKYSVSLSVEDAELWTSIILSDSSAGLPQL